MTKITTQCPTCQKQFQVPPTFLGRTATCQGCKSKFEVVPYIDRGPTQSIPPEVPQKKPSPAMPDVWETGIENQNQIVAKPDRKAASPVDSPTFEPIAARSNFFKKPVPVWMLLACIAGVSLALFPLGVWAGREQVRREIRTAMETARDALVSGMGGVPGKSGKTAVAEPSEKSEPPVPMGQSFKGVFCTVKVIGARVGPVELYNRSRDLTYEFSEKCTQITFEIVNTDDRKIVSFYPERGFSSRISVRDDVGNVIRGMSFGIDNAKGAVRDFEDIEPGKRITHVEVFSAPPPKTQHLIVSVDMKAFGEAGIAKFMIDGRALAQ